MKNWFKEDELPPVTQIFHKYAHDNREILSVLGVLATICALFLSVSDDTFQTGLREIQLLLLLFFTFALMLSAITTFNWFVKNADSFFTGLIGYSYLLLSWKLLVFIAENFRGELNAYLNHISISVIIVVTLYAYKVQNSIERYFERFQIPKAFLYSLTAFLFLYCTNVFLNIYFRYANGEIIHPSIFISYLYNPIVLGMTCWVFIDTYYLMVYQNPQKWLAILIRFILPILIFISYFFIPYLTQKF